ncbi:MAG: HAD-IC family P-type ATPase [Aureispira sp.]|nr:HAD-IC family P-type ATPase [Aureispira sp.]
MITKEELSSTTSTQCYHCGDQCDKHPILYQEKSFCCEGCKTVYDILKENNLSKYYSIENSPGAKMNKGNHKEKYTFLDADTVKEQLLDFYENGIGRITFSIPEIHCSSCIWLLENLPKLHEGVKQSMVNFLKKEASITFDESIINLRQLVELLTAIGYEPNINLASKKENKQQQQNRSLYYKIGVAGFCFGNIMLFSFPDYLAFEDSTLVGYAHFFTYLSFVLALPVLFYSGWGYFVSAYKSLSTKVINIDVPISLGIATLFLRSSYEIFSHTGTGYLDSLAGLVFFLLIGKWFQNKTYQSLSFDRDYKSYFPIAVSKITDTKEDSILVEDIKIGDHIKVRNQEIIPVDATLLSPSANIDYSFVSGESEPVVKQLGDKIYAGGRQIGSTIQLEVTKKVKHSYFTQLWNQQAFEKENDSKIGSIVNTVSKYFTLAILAIAFITFGYWAWAEPSNVWLAFTAVLIIACPCALALSMPFAFGNTLRILGTKGFYIKNTDAIEHLTQVDTIVFDKTGTLTHHEAAHISFIGDELDEITQAHISALTQHSTHPLSIMLSNWIKVKPASSAYFEEVPGKGLIGVVDNIRYKIGSPQLMDITAYQNQDLASQVYIMANEKLLGYFHITKKYRSGFDTLLQQLQTNYQIHLLSGDNDAERQQLEQFFPSVGQMHFKQSPMEKLKYIQNLQSKGHKVLMIGDGLNDAGALKQSNVGIAISDDIHSFSPASDAILDAKEFNNLGNYIKFAQQSLNVVKASFILSLLYNTIGLYFAVQCLLTPLIAAILMPLSSITVVAFVTVLIRTLAKYTINSSTYNSSSS